MSSKLALLIAKKYFFILSFIINYFLDNFLQVYLIIIISFLLVLVDWYSHIDPNQYSLLLMHVRIIFCFIILFCFNNDNLNSGIQCYQNWFKTFFKKSEKFSIIIKNWNITIKKNLKYENIFQKMWIEK